MMGQRKLIDNYFCDVNNLAELLSKYVSSYRLLIGGASEINQITLARKKEVRDALKRADNLGKIIDELIEIIGKTNCIYMDYCDIKADCIEERLETKYVQTEIEDEIGFKNEVNKKRCD